MIKERLKEWCPASVHQWYADTKYYLRFKFYPQGLASEMFRGILGYEMDWNCPQDLNEKINWMKFYYDTSVWTCLADKYMVREYVKERVGEKILPKVYGVWKQAKSINLDQLPQKFVFKTNHGCGTVMPVLNKDELDITSVRLILNKWVRKSFGYETVEPHYLRIKPLIYAEEYLENNVSFSSSLVDYKVFCFSGKPYCILVCTNRELGKHTNLSFYDCNWNPMNEILSGSHKGEFVSIPQPACLPELLKCASLLSEGHPQVRVDFYIVNEQIYFGEMTFTSQGGYMDYISRDYSIEMGKLVKLTV